MKKSFTVLFLFFSILSFAQFSDYYNYYLYIPRGETSESCNNIYYAHFDSDARLYCSTIHKSTLIDKYNSGVIDEYAINKSHNCLYDSNISTYKYEVYVSKTYTQRNLWGSNLPMCDPYTGEPVMDHSGYRYYAFSLDRSEMIIWTTSKNNDTPKGKRYYKIVKIGDFIPVSNSTNYDFLR